MGGDLHRLIPPAAYGDQSPRVLAKASFGIDGDAVDPAFWTNYFRCEPSEAHVKTDRGVAPSGSRWAPLPASWALSSETWVNNDQLHPHLSFLVTTLALPRPDFGALLRERSLTSRVFCFWVNDNGDRVPRCAPNISIYLKAGSRLRLMNTRNRSESRRQENLQGVNMSLAERKKSK